MAKIMKRRKSGKIGKSLLEIINGNNINYSEKHISQQTLDNLLLLCNKGILESWHFTKNQLK